MASNGHSDLEAVSPSDRDMHKHSIYSGYSSEPIPAYTDLPSQEGKIRDERSAYYGAPAYEPPKEARICGLRKKTFWILLAVAVVIVIAAAVGGGVGGALSSGSSGSSVASTSRAQPTPTSTSSAAASSSQAITTTTLVGPSNSPQPTLYRDCPSSNNSLYSVTYGSTSYQFRKLCNEAVLNINDVDAPVQGVVKSLDDCINLCATYDNANSTAIQGGRNPICNAVCWRNTFDSRNDWEGGHCFGFTTQNTTVNGETAFSFADGGEICDSAALINQSY